MNVGIFARVVETGLSVPTIYDQSATSSITVLLRLHILLCCTSIRPKVLLLPYMPGSERVQYKVIVSSDGGENFSSTAKSTSQHKNFCLDKLSSRRKKKATKNNVRTCIAFL